MGCNDLKIIVDHKPLTKLFGDRRLDEINNPRLFRLKQRTLMWRFTIEFNLALRTRSQMQCPATLINMQSWRVRP
jgi:hypothetical protein